MKDEINTFCKKYSLTQNAGEELEELCRASYVAGSNDCHESMKESNMIKGNIEMKVNYLKMFLHTIEKQSANISRNSIVYLNMANEYDMICAILSDYEPEAKLLKLK